MKSGTDPAAPTITLTATSPPRSGGPEVTAFVSAVPGRPAGPTELVARQHVGRSPPRSSRGGIVVEGRDIGTVVVPDAAGRCT
ncbi:hypothetical protein HBB16_18850 [Pseudonocardia sp. MCCB 268]|nr:hypothetical protein [Pseudonocardia cytotoxica]